MKTMERQFTVQSSGGVVDAVEERAVSLGARIESKSDTELVAHGGSRARLKLFGVYLKAGRDHLPWKLVASTAPGDDGTAQVVVGTDEGVFLGRVPRLAKEYNTLLDNLERQLS